MLQPQLKRRLSAESPLPRGRGWGEKQSFPVEAFKGLADAIPFTRVICFTQSPLISILKASERYLYRNSQNEAWLNMWVPWPSRADIKHHQRIDGRLTEGKDGRGNVDAGRT